MNPFLPAMDQKKIELAATWQPAPRTSKLPARVLQAIKYMEENLSEKRRLTDRAQAATMSRYHFFRTFKKYLTGNPIKCLILLGLNQTKVILTDEDLNITEVAEAVGFSDVGVLRGRFKKDCGLTPTQFRRLAQRKGREALDWYEYYK